MTSHAAAASVKPVLRESQRVVLEVLRALGCGTDEDIHAHFIKEFLHHSWKPQSVSGLRTRRHELVEAGYVEDSGVTETLPSGRESIVWRCSSAGVREVPQDAT